MLGSLCIDDAVRVGMVALVLICLPKPARSDSSIAFDVDIADGFLQIMTFKDSNECAHRSAVARLTKRKRTAVMNLEAGREVAVHLVYNLELGKTLELNQITTHLLAGESIFKFVPEANTGYRLVFELMDDKFAYRVTKSIDSSDVPVTRVEPAFVIEAGKIDKFCIGNRTIE